MSQLPPKIVRASHGLLGTEPNSVEPNKGSIALGLGLSLAGAMGVGSGLGLCVYYLEHLGSFSAQQLTDIRAMLMIALVSLGVWQWLWLLPMIIFFAVHHRSRTVGGLMLGGGVFFLLNLSLVLGGVGLLALLCQGAGGAR